MIILLWIQLLFCIFFGILSAILSHKIGHWLCSLGKIRFQREGVRFYWNMPENFSLDQKIFTAKGGFGAEFFGLCLLTGMSLILSIVYGIIPYEYLFFVFGYSIGAYIEWWIYPCNDTLCIDFDYLSKL